MTDDDENISQLENISGLQLSLRDPARIAANTAARQEALQD